MRDTPVNRTTGQASILDGNSFRSADLEALPDRERSLVERRRADLGPAYRLFYRRPVEVVRGRGARLWDADGVEYLDCYNNVASVGHAHPGVVEAVHDQLRQLNTHTRYLHEGILDTAELLLSRLPGLDQVMFVNSGSEANDLALRIGREYTGGRAWIATSEAYHGNTALVSAHSPSLAGSESMDPTLRIVDPPDTFRLASSDAAGAAFRDAVARAIDDITASGDGFAGLIIDASFSSDGIFTGEAGMIREAVELVHARGGVVIADEVQPGYGRTGEAFWGFERHGLAPDLVTLGKPMGNGYPVAALVARAEVLEPFATRRPYFNTFGGSPVAMAAARAVLEVIDREGLQEHARRTGEALRAELRLLADRHPLIGDVRGAGLYTGVELILDGDPRRPATAQALAVLEGLRARRVLTSVCGPTNSTLKLRPPLPFGGDDLTWLVEALDGALGDVR